MGLGQEDDPEGSEVGWGAFRDLGEMFWDSHVSGHFGPLESGRCHLWRVEPVCSEVSWISQVLGSGQIPRSRHDQGGGAVSAQRPGFGPSAVL